MTLAINHPIPHAQNLHPRMLNINEASKACGLSPSVLRIWELRYGWPNPKRKANGYRSYSPHLVEDPKRIAKLVKSGTSIRQLIVDGLPRWPVEEDSPAAKPRTLDRTKALPQPSGCADGNLRDEVINALETRRVGLLRELAQRCQWQVRPRDEAAVYLAPLVCGMAELESLERPLPADRRSDLDEMVLARCRQLLRRWQSETPRITLTPREQSDAALTHLAAVALNIRGVSAAVGDHHSSLTVASAACETNPAAITPFGEGSGCSIANLLDAETPLPDWAG
ncbi:MAG: MerR family transcriptional regulator [Planctomycetota bacterium]